MEKSSKEEQKWQEDVYWNNFRRTRFISHLSGDFHEQLVIPEKFASKMKNKLPDTVVLRGPSKNVWNVGLIVEEDKLILKDGWKEFVEDHSLKENDAMVFEYNFDSHFDVFWFDHSSLCENESSYFVKRISETNEPQIKRKTKETAIHPQPKRSKTMEDVHITGEEQDVAKMSKVSYLWCISNRRAVTEEEKEEALQRARAAANADSVVVVLRPKNVYQCFTMGFSHKWMGKYVSLEDKFLFLSETGKKKDWGFPLKHILNGDTWQLKFGWENFALENNLEESDVCVFNPAGRDGDGILLVHVTIFRVV